MESLFVSKGAVRGAFVVMSFVMSEKGYTVLLERHWAEEKGCFYPAHTPGLPILLPEQSGGCINFIIIPLRIRCVALLLQYVADQSRIWYKGAFAIPVHQAYIRFHPGRCDVAAQQVRLPGIVKMHVERLWV